MTQGDSPARSALLRLLEKGERARTAGREETTPLTLGGRDGREYGALASYADREAFHAEISLAERAGAITVKRERTGGTDPRPLQLRLLDLDRLASHLGIELLYQRVSVAAGLLLPLADEFPCLHAVLEEWQRGRKVRGAGPEAASDLADAAHAVRDLRGAGTQERLLRKESRRLFGDSKRLQALTRWLELMHFDALSPTGLEERDIWSALGLRPMPQPLLVAGHANITIDGGVLAPCRPWLGLPPVAVTGVRSSARWLLTVENLTSFHEAALALEDRPGLLLWTAGMPSPAFRALYARVLAGMPEDAEIYHWGDIDEGGYRIAAVLAESARAAGRVLQPWLMCPDRLNLAAPIPPVPSGKVRAMQRQAQRAGWNSVADALAATPVLLEQEAIPATLPT